MVLNIIFKEIKYQLTNITFYGFFVVVLLMFFSQLGIPVKEDLALPTQSEKFYSTEKIIDNDEKMKKIYLLLNKNYSDGTVLKYKFSFGYNSSLTDIQRTYLKAVIYKIYTIDTNVQENYLITETNKNDTFDDETNLKLNVSYDEFLDILKDLDKNLGGNTIYSDPEKYRIYYKEISLTDAEKVFSDVMENDKFTNAYGRFFADYLGITAGFFPVFLSGFILAREKKKKDYEKTYKSKISFNKYLMARYIGLCICIMGCYFILATYATIAYSKFALDLNCIIDKMAIYKYTFGWIGPTVLFTTALGILISAIFNEAILVIVCQLALCFSSIRNLIGQYGLTKYIIRFNVFGENDSYLNFKSAIIQNRIFYTVFSFVIILLSSYIWIRLKEKKSENFHL